ncbi:MAG: sporulation protein YunB [Erysipelotrichales bacterium]|nr:sporulation protein YunB [Erysipelotrichales bacterium]
MRKFKTKYNKGNNYYLTFIFIIILVLSIINYYNKQISSKLLDISETKIEEITNIYIKNNIVPKNVDLSKLMVVNKNSNEEIVSVDIENNYANQIMIDVVKKIQNNIFELNINDPLLKKYKDITYISIPLFLAYDGVLLSNLGPKIPIRLSFYEHAFGNIEVELVNYGINNALVKIFLEISLEQKIYIPYKEVNKTKEFRLLIGSKIINGTVPSIYGGLYKQNVDTVNT